MSDRPASDYEKQESKKIYDWENEEPSIVKQAVSSVLMPVTWLVQQVIPDKAIEGALTLADSLADWCTDTGDILRDGNVSKISDLKHGSLEVCDKLADSVHNWALALAAVEGGATGYFGLPGMVVDIPSLITLSLRTIHKIGLCYGYEAHTEKDKQFILGILSAAGANNPTEKAASLATLNVLRRTISNVAWKNMAEQGATGVSILAIKQLAKQLGINLTKRKALQLIPVAGGGIGAAMNASFINDVGWAARRSFQKRWLDENCVVVE